MNTLTPEMEDEVINQFGNRLRIRVCGILVENNEVLMAEHRSLGEAGILWIPPGGGMHFGFSVQDNLAREFLEETGLKIDVERFLFINEYLNPPFHAIELFFRVKKTGGTLATGYDPEMGRGKQIIKRIMFMGPDDLRRIPENQLHGVFANITEPDQLLEINGAFYNGNKGKFG